MKKFLYILPIAFILSIISVSCGSDTPDIDVTLYKDWYTVERTLMSNDEEVNSRVNSLFKEDSRYYIIKREFNQVEIGSGSTVTTGWIKGSSSITPERRNDGTYTLTRDSIFIQDLLGHTSASYNLGEKWLITNTKVTKSMLDAFMSEIGGDIMMIPDNISGELKTVEYYKPE